MFTGPIAILQSESNPNFWAGTFQYSSCCLESFQYRQKEGAVIWGTFCFSLMKEIPVVIKLLEDISFLTSYPLFYPCDPRLLHWQLPRLTDKAPLASCLPYVPPQASCTDSYFECFFATACRGAKMFWTSLSKIKEGERHTNGHPKRKIVPPVSLLSQVLGSLSGWGAFTWLHKR